MITAYEIFLGIENSIPILTTIIILILIFVLLNTGIKIIKKRLLSKAKTKKQITNIEVFSRMLKYILLVFLLIIAVSSYSGSWEGIGISIGLFSAAIGFALQKPIAGLAAWIMVITKRPFEIGDRIIIGNLKGDVIDITLTHIYLKEIGGTIPGEEKSGRITLIPNAILFEQNIINYSFNKEETVLGEVIATVTYESNLDKAMELILNATKKHVNEFVFSPKKEPYTRISFQSSGIDIQTRYFVPVRQLHEISSKITKEIHSEVTKTNSIEFAYPHTEIIFKDKNFNKKI